MQNEWYVISGGPGTGKTTLRKQLEMRGYATVPEMARHCIDEGLSAGKAMSEIVADAATFQHAVLEHQVLMEKHLPKDRVTFFDRGIPDSLAYYRYHHLPEDEAIKTAVAGCSYKKAFLLDPLPIISDYARTENEKQQQEICSLIRETYEALPFPVVRVPVMPADERVAFILENL